MPAANIIMSQIFETYRSQLPPETRFVCDMLSNDANVLYLSKILMQLKPSKLLEVLQWHRVYPAFYSVWRNLPPHNDIAWQKFELDLKSLVEKNRLRMMQKTVRLIQVIKALENAGIPAISLKGPALAFQLFGDVTMRSSWDLDILVPPEFLAQAVEVIKGLHYSNFFLKDKLTPKQWNYSIKHFHHFTFFDEDNCVELHWRLMHVEHLTNFRNADLWIKPRQIEVAGAFIKVLDNKFELAHLAAHGASHSFFRLAWLYDLAAFQRLHEDDFVDLYHVLESDGCASLLQTVYACSDIAFKGNTLPVGDVNLKFVNHFIGAIKKPESKRFKSVILNEYLGKILLLKGWRKKLNILQIISTSPKDWATLKLNDRLFFLYFVLRPFLALTRVVFDK
jgi:hypothetical protein